MKSVNLLCLAAVYKTGNNALFDRYVEYSGIGEAQGGIRKSEMNDLCTLIDDMVNHGADRNNLDNYFAGYSIPQIGKEFDLLRFDADTVVDIETKCTSTVEKIEKQLLRNAYYLSFLPMKNKCLFSYVCDTKTLYMWTGKVAKQIPMDKLIEVLDNMGHYEVNDIDGLFNPANYLVSPFNSTDAFARGRYFLTKQQEEFRTQMLKTVEKGGKCYLALTGKPGTGKTLLLYDVARALMDKGLKVLVIHSGSLNGGQLRLNTVYGWNIIAAKCIWETDLTSYDAILVDESQRIYTEQLRTIIKNVNASGIACIFSFDAEQCLSMEEIRRNNVVKISRLCGQQFYKLTGKIRTNREVAEFISRLLDKKSGASIKRYPNVSVSFCMTAKDARKHLEMLRAQGWTVVVYTPGQYGTFDYEKYGIRSQSAHEVIGQEFDRVVAVIDSDFTYDDNGRLVVNANSNDRIYSRAKMFYQIISRTRRQLHLLLINNPTVFGYCLSLLKSN